MNTISAINVVRIDDRIKELDELIPALEKERAGLQRLKVELLVDDVVRPGEKVNLRTQRKFLVLAQVVDILKKHRRQAQSEADLRNKLYEEMGQSRRAKAMIGLSSSAIYDALKRRGQDINYGTLRSYLTRAKKSGLLDNDENIGGWHTDDQIAE